MRDLVRTAVRSVCIHVVQHHNAFRVHAVKPVQVLFGQFFVWLLTSVQAEINKFMSIGAAGAPGPVAGHGVLRTRHKSPV